MHAAYEVVLLGVGSFRQRREPSYLRQVGCHCRVPCELGCGPRRQQHNRVSPVCEPGSPLYYPLHIPAQAEVALLFTRACLRLQSVVYNGLSDGKAFGTLNVDNNEITHKFELHVRPPEGEGSQTPINMPYIKFSLFDFDENPNALGREVSRAPWPCLWLRPTVITHHLAVRRCLGVLRLCALR